MPALFCAKHDCLSFHPPFCFSEVIMSDIFELDLLFLVHFHGVSLKG